MKNSDNNNPAVTIGRISYINIDPVYCGLDRGMKPSWVNIISAPPSSLNRMLFKGEIDISPVSSVAYAEHQDEWLLLPDLSISCLGEVMSVILVSKVPFNKLNNEKILLTDASASAAKLIKLLFKKKKINPVFERGAAKKPGDIYDDTSAVLVIGDAALNKSWSSYYKYVWDLGEMWKDLTGLPFVFSVWAVRKAFADKRPEVVASIFELFQISKKEGHSRIDEIYESASLKLHLNIDTCKKYYNNLCYDLGKPQINGLNTFLNELYREKLCPGKGHLSFFHI